MAIATKEGTTSTKENDIYYDEIQRGYACNGVKLKGVTTWLDENYVREFDAMGAAIGVKRAASNKGEQCPNPNVLMKIWNLKGEIAKNLGNIVHKTAELYEVAADMIEIKIPQQQAVINFLEFIEDGYKSIGSEVKVWNPAYGLMGIIDKVLLDKKTGNAILVDFKPSTDLDKGKVNMLNGLKMYKQTKRNIHTAQLTSYKFLYENCAIKNSHIVQEMWIVLINESSYEIVKVKPMIEVIREIENSIDYEQAFNTK